MMSLSQETTEKTLKTLDFAAGARVFSARILLQNVRSSSEALETIHEVVCDYVGAEEAVLFEVDPQKTALWLHWSCGIDPKSYPFADAIPKPLLERVIAGKSFFREEPAEEGSLAANGPNAVIPILVDGDIAGILAIFRLRPEKSCLEAPDRRICESIAICCSRVLALQLV